MTEADLLNHLSDAIDRMWSLLQWWASISFGVLLVSHLASEKLNALLATILGALYLAFSIAVFDLIQSNAAAVRAVIADLQAMQTTEIELSQVAVHWATRESLLLEIVLPGTIVTTLVSVLFYLIYSFRRSPNEQNA